MSHIHKSPPVPETEVPELSDWDPDRLLEEAAASRGLTTEQLRGRLRALADSARGAKAHVGFDHVRDGNFSDEELAHLERGCSFCEQLIRTIKPDETAVEEFQTRVEERFGKSRGRFAWPAFIPLAAAAGAGAVAVSAWLYLTSASTGVITAPQSTAAYVPNAISVQPEPGVTLFNRAVRYQREGKSEIANALIVAGLSEAGVADTTLKQVTAAIDPTRPVLETALAPAPAKEPGQETIAPDNGLLFAAQSEFQAGKSVAGYEQIVTYLKQSEETDGPAETFETAFVRPVRTSLAGSQGAALSRTYELLHSWIRNIKIGTKLDDTGLIAFDQATTSFVTGEPVYLLTQVQGAPRHVPIQVLWFGPDNQKLREELNWTTGEDGVVGFNAFVTPSWKTGQYRAEIWVAGQKVEQQPFQVARDESRMIQ